MQPDLHFCSKFTRSLALVDRLLLISYNYKTVNIKEDRPYVS